MQVFIWYFRYCFFWATLYNLCTTFLNIFKFRYRQNYIHCCTSQSADDSIYSALSSQNSYAFVFSEYILYSVSSINIVFNLYVIFYLPPRRRPGTGDIETPPSVRPLGNVKTPSGAKLPLVFWQHFPRVFVRQQYGVRNDSSLKWVHIQINVIVAWWMSELMCE